MLCIEMWFLISSTSDKFSSGGIPMRIWLASVASQGCRIGKIVAGAVAVIALTTCAFGQSSSEVGGEANLKLPELSQVNFLGTDGHPPLLIGILFCGFG